MSLPHDLLRLGIWKRPDGHWVWLRYARGGTNPQSTALGDVAGTQQVRRYLYILEHGSVPRERYVRRRCQNPRCVNPACAGVRTEEG